jgi:hypothetical protein
MKERLQDRTGTRKAPGTKGGRKKTAVSGQGRRLDGEEDGQKPLSIQQLYRLSLLLCREIHHPPVSFAAVRRHVEEEIPLVVENRDGCVWIDGLYAALEELDEPFRYVYLHANHIREERQSYAQADPEGKGRDWISPEILHSFDRAEREMRFARRQRWVDSRVVPYLIEDSGKRAVSIPGMETEER